MANGKNQNSNAAGSWGSTGASSWGNSGTGSTGASSWGNSGTGSTGASSWGNSGTGSTGMWGASGSLGSIPSAGWGTPGNGFGADNGKTVLSVGRFVLCLLSGFLGMLLSLFLYHKSALPAVLKIGLSALLSAGLPLIAAVVFTRFSRQRRQLRSGSFLLLMGALAALFVVGVGMQFLYSLGVKQYTLDIQDYVFVIDDSGSMGVSDPQYKRISSLRGMLGDVTEDKRVGLVSFTDAINFEVPLSWADAGQVERMLSASQRMESSGGTDIYCAVDCALRMLDDRQDRDAMIVLLTDGESNYSLRTNELVGRCMSQRTVISAICMDQYVLKTLTELTGRTGGQLYSVDDPDLLQDIYQNINVVRYDRDLLGLRTGLLHGSLILAMVRILAWLLIGGILGAALVLTIESDVMPQLQLLVSLIAGAVLGIVLELMNALWLDSALFQGFGLLLYGIVLLFDRKAVGSSWGQAGGAAFVQRNLSAGANHRLQNIENRLRQGENVIRRK